MSNGILKAIEKLHEQAVKEAAKEVAAGGSSDSEDEDLLADAEAKLQHKWDRVNGIAVKAKAFREQLMTGIQGWSKAERRKRKVERDETTESVSVSFTDVLNGTLIKNRVTGAYNNIIREHRQETRRVLPQKQSLH